MFRVGQKVTMINEWPSVSGKGYGDEIMTQMGVVYTIRDFVDVNGHRSIWVCEIVNQVRKYAGLAPIEQPFPLRNFRPVTDIGFAHEILRKATKPAPARTAFQDAE